MHPTSRSRTGGDRPSVAPSAPATRTPHAKPRVPPRARYAAGAIAMQVAPGGAIVVPAIDARGIIPAIDPRAQGSDVSETHAGNVDGATGACGPGHFAGSGRWRVARLLGDLCPSAAGNAQQ